MAITDVNLAGYVRSDNGDAVSGITVSLLHASTDSGNIDGGAETTTTTNSNGYWSFTETSLDSNYDIKISSDGGGQLRYIPWVDEITLKTVDASVLKVRGASNTAAAPIYLFADLATDAGDAWRIQATDSDTLAIGSDKASAGTIIDYITITNGANAAASNTTILGQLTIGVDDTGADVKFFGATAGSYWLWDESADGVVQVGTLTVGVDDAGHDVKFFGDTASRYWLWDTSADGVVQRGTLTVGVDDTGHDVKFFGASAGAYMEWDESADQLRIMGASADATTSTGKLLLATSLTDVNANDVIGKIEFQAPHEAGGTDAITVAASIQAIAQGTFSASVNATDLIFLTGHSEAATEKFRFTSQGEIGIGGANYGSSGDVLTSGGAGAAPTWETPTTGDITGVSAGVGLSGGGSSGDVTLTLDLSELSTVTPADGDFFATLDSDGANEQKTTTTALATLLAGTVTSTGISASSSVLTLDIQNMTASTTIADADLVVIDDGAGGTLRKMTRANFIESAALDAINIDGGAIDGAVIGANSAAAITGTTIDASTDFTIGTTVITDDSIVMTPSTSDTVTIAAATNGVLNITTVDNAAAAANIQITADGTAELAGTTVTLDSAADIELEATNDINVPSGVGLTFADDGQKIESDGTDFTIASGAKLNLTATSDVHVANGTGLVVGHTAQETISIGDGDTDLVPEVQVLGTGQADSSIMLATFSTTATSAGAPLLAFVKGGHGTIGSHTVVTDDEELGNIIAYGDDGTDLEAVAAQIQFEVDGTPGTGDMPGRIVFATTADGAETATEAMRITSAGRVGIDVDPSTTLHVNAAGGAGVRISRDSNAGYLNLDTDGTNAHISNPGGSGTLIFKVNGDNERARIDANGTFTVGTDGGGGDVTFYSATSGDNLTWDASHEVLNITGTNGATALDVLDGDLRVVDTLYLYDRGGESISSDGTDLTIASGDDIFLTATGAVKVADKIGIGTEDAKGAFYFIPLNTQDVSTSATTISGATDFGVLTFVTGEEGVVRFADLVIFGYDSVTVISSHSVRGSPPARTYSVSGQELKLAMDSGTYDISVMQIQAPNPT